MPKYKMEEAIEDGKKQAKVEGLRRKGYSEVGALKMVSMKKEKKDSEMPSTAPIEASSEESYPYGLRIRLENDELEKLGMKDLPMVGKSCKLEAEGVVESVSSNESKGEEGSRKCVEIQITGLNLHSPEADKKKDSE